MKASSHYIAYIAFLVLLIALSLSATAGNVVRTPGGSIECTGIVQQVCHIRLTTTISAPENYQDIFRTIRSADVVYIHLVGNGGQVQTAKQFYNVIKSTKAKVITVVEGDVYSAHAFITMMGDEIIIGDNVTMLIHTSSILGAYKKYCSSNNINEDGTHKLDRGQSAYDKCIDFYSKGLAQTERLIFTLFSRVLTMKEYKQVIAGHDIILTGEEVRKRLNKK